VVGRSVAQATALKKQLVQVVVVVVAIVKPLAVLELEESALNFDQSLTLA
jgi:transketolase C-terminal domain/subunit